MAYIVLQRNEDHQSDNHMDAPKLHIASDICDRIENLWVTNESTVIHLSIEVSTGRVINFSCRLGAGIVAEMGEARNSMTDERYPMLCIFSEDEDHNSSPQQFCRKYGSEWQIES
jgi:hypothetical protein